jgi:hypothetical protein
MRLETGLGAILYSGCGSVALRKLVQTPGRSPREGSPGVPGEPSRNSGERGGPILSGARLPADKADEISLDNMALQLSGWTWIGAGERTAPSGMAHEHRVSSVVAVTATGDQPVSVVRSA